MIDLYRTYLGFSKKDFNTFKKIYKECLLKYRKDNKFYAYGKDYLSTALVLALLLKEDIDDLRILLTCIILNGYSNDTYNFQPLGKEYKYQLKDILNKLLEANLYTSKEIFYIESILSSYSSLNTYIEDYQRDFQLFEDFRQFFKIIKLNDDLYIKMSDEPKKVLITKYDTFPLDDYLTVTKQVKNSIKNSDLKILYQLRINKFVNTLNIRE